MELAKFDGNLADLNITNYGDLSVLRIDDSTQVPLFDAIPFWAQFIQPGSVKKNPKFKKRVGQFYFSTFATEEDDNKDAQDDGTQTDSIEEANIFSESLRVLPIGLIGYRRILLPEFDSGVTDPICQSRDGIWPSPKIDVPKCAQCGTWKTNDKGPYIEDMCPVGAWKDGVKPECQKSQIWAFYDLDRKAPIGIELKGVNVSAMSKVRKKLQVLQWKAVTQGEDLKEYYVKMTGSNEGTYYQIQFTFCKSEDLHPEKFYSAVGWYQAHLLKTLGTNPEKPQAYTAANMQQVSMSTEDRAALEAEQLEAVQDFDV